VPRKRRAHVYGPYPEQLADGLRWRIVYVNLAGQRTAISFRGEGAEERAAQEADKLRSEIAGRTVSDAIEDYLAEREADGAKPISVKTTRFRLRGLLGVDEKKGLNGGPLAELTPKRAAALFEALRVRRSVDTARNSLGEAGTWARWCVKRGWLRVDPFAGLRPRGRRRRGKPQHTTDEARKFERYLLAVAAAPLSPDTTARRRWDHAVSNRQGAIGTLTALLLGLRASEVVDRQVRDLDDDGWMLWVPEAKTEAGKRRQVVPEHLRPLLQELCAGRAGDERIWSGRGRTWLLRRCKALCEAAGVPVISLQGLRGTHASLAVQAGASPLDVSRALGHAGTAVTERHYTTVEAQADGRQQRALTVLAGGKR
jgi:integrase